MKPEQERLVTVLKDTISLLCKNSLTYDKQVVVQGLICVTVDKQDVLVVQVNDTMGDAVYDPCTACGHVSKEKPAPVEPASTTPSDNRKRPRSPSARESHHTPSKTARSTRSQAAAADSDTELSDTGFDLLPVKKEEMRDDEDEDEDLVLIGEELGKGEPHATLTGSGGGSGYNLDQDSSSSSFHQQQQGQGSSEGPYITGFMQNTQITPMAGSSQQQDGGSAGDMSLSPGAWDPNMSQGAGGMPGSEPSMMATSGIIPCIPTVYGQPELPQDETPSVATVTRKRGGRSPGRKAEADGGYQCSYCDKAFSRRQSMIQHEKWIHRDAHYGKTLDKTATPQKSSQKDSGMCAQCGKTFPSMTQFCQHLLQHSASLEFVCDVCNRRFFTKHSLRIHQGHKKHFGKDDEDKSNP